MQFLEHAPRHLFFTGKGGVGKTSIACAAAVALADQGRRVLLVSTDPASNLDEVLGVALSTAPREVPGAPGLRAMNLDPEAAAGEYRERVVGPYRGLLPEAAVRSIEEQLSGACTVEIATFDEFSKLLGDPAATAEFDHVIFDTAPTGHTLRLLELPAAWSGFLATGGTSCLGPLAGLQAQRLLYERSREALHDPASTMVVLVARAERSALAEAERTRRELTLLGVSRLFLVLNGIFVAQEGADPVARALEAQGREALETMPRELAALARGELPLLPCSLAGIEALRGAFTGTAGLSGAAPGPGSQALPGMEALVEALAERDHGVVLTMGKGGVGKTSVAVFLAVELARRGRRVHLTTTDPAAHVQAELGEPTPGLRVSRIDPVAETAAYQSEVLRTSGAHLDADGRALLEEDLRSPCTEEIAVFRAFARVVAEGTREIVVIDTAPTGHTLLLLDAAESYHREVLRARGAAPDEVRELLPRLRDGSFTRILLVTLPEATPVHEAAALQRDLARAGMTPFAWVINQSLLPLSVQDPVLRARRSREASFIEEVRALCPRFAVVPWVHQERGHRRLTRTTPEAEARR